MEETMMKAASRRASRATRAGHDAPGARRRNPRARTAAAAGGLILVMLGTAAGDDCRTVLRSAGRSGHAVQRAEIERLVFFQVGSALREEAVAQRAAEIALARFLALLQPRASDGLRPSAVGEEGSTSAVRRSCVSCHGGAAPEAGLDLANLEKLSAADRLEAVARVVSDDPARRMPPGPGLAPAEIGTVLQELSAGP
jgi:hypothetical protein